MNIMAVDDERPALKQMEKAIRKAAPDANVAVFAFAEEALEYAQCNHIDIAFLDIAMDGMNGLVLAKHLKDIYEETNIIFVTGYPQYGLDAFQVRASGYLLKPVSAEDVSGELAYLRSPVVPQDKGVRIQCFGNFEVFVDGRLLPFRWAKAKEIFAYLVDRKGASVSKKEIAAILWEDEEYSRSKQMQLQKLITEMKQSLENAGAGSLIVQLRGYYAVDVSKVNCDYYNYDKGDMAAVNSYHGEYMSNYAWGEFTAGQLTRP